MLTRQDVESVLDYLDKNNIIRLARSSSNSKWQQLHCPFHNNGQERRPSCGCSLEEEIRNGVTYHIGVYHCFACGATYSFVAGTLEILKLKGTSVEAHPFLKPYMEGQVQQDIDSLVPTELLASVVNKYAAESLRMRLQGKQMYVSEEELQSYRFIVPYMYQRKLTDAVIEKYDVGFDGKFVPPGRKKNLPSITFPVRDIQGHTLFICRRSVEGKFFSLPTNIEKPVYGIYELPPNTREVIICESIFNALTCVVYGHPAVALLGTGTPYQMDQLRKLGVQSFVICLDNDEAGRKGTERIKKALSGYAMVWTMTVPDDGRDVNDLDYETFEKCYASRE